MTKQKRKEEKEGKGREGNGGKERRRAKASPELNWTELNRTELNWTEQHGIVPNLSKKCVGKSCHRGSTRDTRETRGAWGTRGGRKTRDRWGNTHTYTHNTVQWTIFTLLGAFAVDKKFSSFYIVLEEWRKQGRAKREREGGKAKRKCCGSKRRANRFFYCAPQRVYPRVHRGMVISFRSSLATATGTLELVVFWLGGRRNGGSGVKPLATNTNC